MHNSSSSTDDDLSSSSNLERRGRRRQRNTCGHRRGSSSVRGRGRGRLRGGRRGGVRGGRRRGTRGGGRGGGRSGVRGRGATGSVRARGGEPSSERNWEKKQPSSYHFPYVNSPGPKNDLQPDATSIDLFSRFFTDNVLALIVTETNRYAAANRSITRHSRAWSDVTVEEMKAFVGMLILMGILQLLRLEMYWQTTHSLIITTGMSAVMSGRPGDSTFSFVRPSLIDTTVWLLYSYSL